MPTRSEHNIDDAHDPPEHDRLTIIDRARLERLIDQLYTDPIDGYDHDTHVNFLDPRDSYNSATDLRNEYVRARDILDGCITIIDRAHEDASGHDDHRGGSPG